MSEFKPLMAALRDASWHDHPDVHSPKMFHIIGSRGLPACGRQSLLVDETAMIIRKVPRGRRCMHNGCKQWWPED